MSRAEWEQARAELLVRDKKLTRLKDSVSAARRRLPMVEITEPYVFDSESGPVSLLDLFDGDRVFHTWSTYSRGEEPFMVVFDLRDLTPFGRQETWEDSPEGWPQQPPYEWMRLHDSY